MLRYQWTQSSETLPYYLIRDKSLRRRQTISSASNHTRRFSSDLRSVSPSQSSNPPLPASPENLSTRPQRGVVYPALRAAMALALDVNLHYRERMMVSECSSNLPQPNSFPPIKEATVTGGAGVGVCGTGSRLTRGCSPALIPIPLSDPPPPLALRLPRDLPTRFTSVDEVKDDSSSASDIPLTPQPPPLPLRIKPRVLSLRRCPGILELRSKASALESTPTTCTMSGSGKQAEVESEVESEPDSEVDTMSLSIDLTNPFLYFPDLCQPHIGESGSDFAQNHHEDHVDRDDNDSDGGADADEVREFAEMLPTLLRVPGFKNMCKHMYKTQKEAKEHHALIESLRGKIQHLSARVRQLENQQYPNSYEG